MKELIETVVENDYDYNRVFNEIVEIWEGKKAFKESSWEARMVFSRWIAGKQEEAKYNEFAQN
jgi:hypothetical protein